MSRQNGLIIMGKHSKKQDEQPVTVAELPTYPCQHTGHIVFNGRVQCSGCGKDLGEAQPYDGSNLQ